MLHVILDTDLDIHEVGWPWGRVMIAAWVKCSFWKLNFPTCKLVIFLNYLYLYNTVLWLREMLNLFYWLYPLFTPFPHFYGLPLLSMWCPSCANFTFNHIFFLQLFNFALMFSSILFFFHHKTAQTLLGTKVDINKITKLYVELVQGHSDA